MAKDKDMEVTDTVPNRNLIIIIVLWVIYLVFGVTALITHQDKNTLEMILFAGGFVCAVLTLVLTGFIERILD